MTGNRSLGEALPLPPDGHDRAGDLRAIVPARPDLPAPADDIWPGNVVRLVRAGANDNAHPVRDIALPPDIAGPPVTRTRDVLIYALGAALSFAVHAGVLACFMLREEPPLAAIGLEVVSVELVLGATAPAGVASTPGASETQAASAPETQSIEIETSQQAATAQPQDVKRAETEAAPDVRDDSPAAPSSEYETAATPDAPPAGQPPQPPLAMVEAPQAEVASASPPEQETPAARFSMTPPPQDAPERKPDPKAEARKVAPPKPVKDAVPAKERRRVAAPTHDKPARDARASTPSSQANNVGIGRSSDDTNYRGLVAAHLARHKQYPADARGRGASGTASVTFAIGGGGGVTSVRLAHSSGVASIDAEVAAMVRRASPFPPPPGGRAQSFTVPVSFRLN